MTTDQVYAVDQPTPADIEQLTGLTVLEFGVDWCPHCQAAQPLIAAALAEHPGFSLLKVEDGKGRRLGRLFRVKLWPTLILLQNGNEVSRLVRPTDAKLIVKALLDSKI